VTGTARPAFYALSPGGWRDYVTLLHPPYTLWHLSYVAIGAALAPHFKGDVLGLGLLAFFLGMGVGAHALDELNGRPLQTRIGNTTLVALAAASLAGAAAIGIAVAVRTSLWLLVFVAAGTFIAVAYNLELFGGRFHTDFWLAFAWAAFPALTSWWINTLSLASLKTDVAGLLVAAGCFGLVSVQRRLSTPVRRLRRKTVSVSGEQRLDDGTVIPLTVAELAGPLDGSLRGLSWAVVVLAAGLVVIRY
jgi:hypothetical protein